MSTYPDTAHRAPESWVRSGALTGARELIIELGGDPEAVCLSAGVPSQSLNEGDFPLTATQFVSFLEQAARQTKHESFGVQLAAKQSLAVLGPVWLLMQSASTVLEMLQDLARYFMLHTRGAQVMASRTAEGLSIGYSLSPGIPVSDVQTIELGIAVLCNELRGYAPRGWQPSLVEFRHSAPQDLGLHRKVFGSNLVFDQARSTVLLEHDLLKGPIVSGSMLRHRQIEALLDTRRGATPKDVVLKVEETVGAMLPYSACSRQQIASALRLSERTLQRRLAECGESFGAIRDRMRAELALRYLRQSRLSQAEIAEILGFSDVTAFCRAFRRWHGMTAGKVDRASRL
ncbi:AraC family transcriptional regulator [Paraburkholderia sp. BL23I1N1]|uniref:AraC family transcriptional regulator n=1 Tax=Paraburkholderia sp. BL23I1N1 TaxID=1938802 RepID=UPI00160018FD|nr:AraC family transcriptional regulator [Paraburkholderia sp. BL23I1N1]